ncbi:MULTISPECIES: hypothetical protein [Providencia]|uniref:hypothetical protein n=1 Tax=Providencia TaxID=586 RepID=UPI0018C6559D|nr:hypothetical protein [Providencia sp. PROV212]MBG5881524.1 hypothetical protein [Providencia alcalifaciens]
MTITYQDLKARMNEVIDDNQKRACFIEENINKLIYAYKKELKLQDESWQDSYGTYREYVSIGTLYGQEFTSQGIDAMITNGREAVFHVGTVVDDSKFGGEVATCHVMVEANQQCDQVTITVLGKPSSSFVINSNEDSEEKLELAAQEMAKATFTDIAKFSSYKAE